MEKLQGFTEAGNTTLVIAGAAGTIARKVQGSYPGCTVTVYRAGTLTLAPIFADNAAVPTGKPNPFVSASDGTWFFYAPNGRYDVKFSGGGIAVPFTLGDFLLFDELELWTDPMRFGAVGDGVTDDTAAFQAAIAATPVGGTLLVPQPRVSYRVSQLTVDHAMTVRGVGDMQIGRVMFQQFDANVAISVFEIIASGVVIDSIAVTGIATGHEADEEDACIHLTFHGAVAPLSNITIQGCYLSGKTAGIFTYNADSTNTFILKNIKILNNICRCIDKGILIGGYLSTIILHSDIEVIGNDCEAPGQIAPGVFYPNFFNARPFEAWNCNDIRVTNNRFLGGFSCGELISSPASGLAHRRGNVFSDNVGDGHLSFTQTDGGVCTGNIVDMDLRPASFWRYDLPAAVAQYGYGSGIECADNIGVVLDSNTVNKQVGASIDFSANRGGVCSNNTMLNSGTTATPPFYASGLIFQYGNNLDSVVSGNTIRGSARSGIWQWTQADVSVQFWTINRLLISGNNISDCQEHGIYFRRVVDGITINDNRITNINIAAGAFDGISLDPFFIATDAIQNAVVRGNTITGSPRYGILQNYLDAGSNRQCFIQNNAMIGTPTISPFWFWGHRGGNWPGTVNPFGTISVVTANHIDLRSGLDAYNVDPGGPATIRICDNITMGDSVLLSFARGDTLMFWTSGNLLMAGTLNVTPTPLSNMTFYCANDTVNTNSAMWERSRMIV